MGPLLQQQQPQQQVRALAGLPVEQWHPLAVGVWGGGCGGGRAPNEVRPRPLSAKWQVGGHKVGRCAIVVVLQQSCCNTKSAANARGTGASANLAVIWPPTNAHTPRCNSPLPLVVGTVAQSHTTQPVVLLSYNAAAAAAAAAAALSPVLLAQYGPYWLLGGSQTPQMGLGVLGLVFGWLSEGF